MFRTFTLSYVTFFLLSAITVFAQKGDFKTDTIHVNKVFKDKHRKQVGIDQLWIGEGKCVKCKSELDSLITVSCHLKRHDCVDLGLPSNRLWATCNIGAKQPIESGDLFAWGESLLKKEYTSENYKWDWEQMGEQYPVLSQRNDAANRNWGTHWRMPTQEEVLELRNSCMWHPIFKSDEGKLVGLLGISKYNGNTIYFPFCNFEKKGDYWTSCISCPQWCGGHPIEYIVCNTERLHYFKVGESENPYCGHLIRAVYVP